ncbi:TetR/AcrR family transcriptional regulator [Halioglobus maricola]|uniref:TetR/AcrR family transcriptional regulator n=1 Tax=Halioglobus maricola TaxID=2601894 RepID=A0A5P9NM09_9GAMM|nr:TetR/AcrR family transcriptional regulator [Halioglobus maricola]QFU76294.1 TetR/AcrR family transcriptional regulator [Halioglobus maricola]
MREHSDYEIRRKQGSARRRIAVLGKAGGCFAELGYKKTTMDEVARRAEVSKGLVYHFFDSKSGLFNAVVEDTLKQWTTFVEYKASGSEETTLEELNSLFITSFDFMERNPVLSLFAREDDTLLAPYLPQIVRQNRRWRDRVRRTLKQGIERGEIRDLDIRRMSLIFHQLQTGLLSSKASENTLPHYDSKTVQLASAVFIRGIQA